MIRRSQAGRVGGGFIDQRTNGVLLALAAGACLAASGCAGGGPGTSPTGPGGQNRPETPAELLARATEGMKKQGDNPPGMVQPAMDQPGINQPPTPPSERAPSGSESPIVSARASTGPASTPTDRVTQPTPVANAMTTPVLAGAGNPPPPAATTPAPIILQRTTPKDPSPSEGSALSTSLPAATLTSTPVTVSPASPLPVANPGNPFRITAFAACTRIDGFGRYVKMEKIPARGSGQPIILYTQLDGFVHRPLGVLANPADEGSIEWEVVVGQSVEIYRLGKAEGLVGKVDTLVSRDVLRGKRRDHYLVQRVMLPPTVKGETYRIKVTVRDTIGGGVTEQTVDVQAY